MAAPPLCGACLLSVAAFTTLSGHLLKSGVEGKDRALGIAGCGASDGKCFEHNGVHCMEWGFLSPPPPPPPVGTPLLSLCLSLSLSLSVSVSVCLSVCLSVSLSLTISNPCEIKVSSSSSLSLSLIHPYNSSQSFRLPSDPPPPSVFPPLPLPPSPLLIFIR